MRAVVDDEFVIAVEGQFLEADHEALQDGLGLEGDDAVEVALVERGDHGTVHGPGNVGEEALFAAFAKFADGNWKERK